MILMFRPLKRYADFRGRACRTEYWSFQLLIAMIVLGAAATGQVLNAVSAPAGLRWLLSACLVAAILGLAIPQWAVTVRRLHDVGRGEGWALFDLHALIYLLEDGQPGPNAHGPDPKGRPSPKAPLSLRT
jgi:uncharacterized membrane protein YhaH (DUF805 family)